MKIMDVDLSIKLDNGIYLMGYDGGTGKTYLSLLLNAYNSIPNRNGDVLVLRYDSNMRHDDYIERIRSFNGILVIVDRFDLFYSDRIISELKLKSCPVLLDLKDYMLANRFEFKYCFIEQSSRNTVRVGVL